MYTVNEIAGIFKVTPRTVRQWMADGAIDYIKIGGAVRIMEDEVDRIKKKRASKSNNQ